MDVAGTAGLHGIAADLHAVHKLTAEWYHRLYARVYGLRTCCLRLTNTYGPRMYVRDGRAIGWPWASFLATLRCAVYLILGLVFLLPAWQVWDATENRSKIVVLLEPLARLGEDGVELSP